MTENESAYKKPKETTFQIIKALVTCHTSKCVFSVNMFSVNGFSVFVGWGILWLSKQDKDIAKPIATFDTDKKYNR